MANPRARIVSVLRRSGPLVTLDDIEAALGVPRIQASKIASSWVQQGRFVRIRRGLYAPVPVDSEADGTTLEQPWQLVPELFGPGFVTGWSTAGHWHLTEQLFRRICVKTAADVRRKIVTVRDAEFYLSHVDGSKIFGTRAHWAGTVRVDVADPHRTVVDMLDDPRLGGGGHHMAECVTAYFGSNHAHPPTLLDYADRLDNGAVFKRLGFLVENIAGEASPLLTECRSRLTKGYAKLDPSTECPRVVTRWRLRVPISFGDGNPHD